jgi:hypothetical protein
VLSGAVALVPAGATVVTVVVRTVAIWRLRLPRAKPTPAKIAMCLKRYRSEHCVAATVLAIAGPLDPQDVAATRLPRSRTVFAARAWCVTFTDVQVVRHRA